MDGTEVISLTVPKEMKEAINKIADKNDRSINKTVIRFIQEAKEFKEFVK